MSDSTKHFDAQRSSSRGAALLALARARWGVLLAMAIAAAIIGAATIGVFAADRAGRALIASAVGSTTIFVQLDGRTSAVDADALGPRIKALPEVADATLVTRDDALKALVAKGLPPPDGRNPLPDVWTVRLNPSPVAPGWAGVVADLRRALAALPQVEATRVDERWVGTVDAALAGWAAWRGIGRPIVYLVLAVLVGCVGFVSGRTFVGFLTERLRLSVLALVVTITAVTGLIFDLLMSGLIGAIMPRASGGVLDTIAASATADAVPSMLLLALALWAVAVGTTIGGARGDDSQKTSTAVTSGYRNY